MKLLGWKASALFLAPNSHLWPWFLNLIEICLASNWMVNQKTSSNKSNDTASNPFDKGEFLYTTWNILSTNHSQTHQPSEQPQTTACTYHIYIYIYLSIHIHIYIWVGLSPGPCTCTFYLQVTWNILASFTSHTHTHIHSHVVAMRCFSPRDFHLFLYSHQTRVKPQRIWGLIYGDDLTGIFSFWL